MKTVRIISIALMATVFLVIATLIFFKDHLMPEDFQYHDTYLVVHPLWAGGLLVILIISIIMYRAGK